MSYKVAGIDVHKKVLMVVVAEVEASQAEWSLQRRRFGTTTSELRQLAGWLREQEVAEAVMESTAQYWKPVWYELEPYMRLQLAQAFSNRAPRGRKHDFRDAERLVRRLVANELILSFVPAAEQRAWRTMTRMKCQLAHDRVRLHNQVECLLEEMRIKLSSVLSDLLGASGQRILRALAAGESDATLGGFGRGAAALQSAATHRCLDGEARAYAPATAGAVSATAAADRGTKPAAQWHDCAGHASASGCSGTAGGGARLRRRLGAASDCGSGRAGQHLSLGGAVDLVGGNLSGAERKRRGEPQ